MERIKIKIDRQDKLVRKALRGEIVSFTPHDPMPWSMRRKSPSYNFTNGRNNVPQRYVQVRGKSAISIDLGADGVLA